MSQEHVNVFTGSSIIVNRLKSLLEQKGIDSIVKDDMESGRLAGFGAPINSSQLFILDSDLKEAKPVVETFQEEINS